MFFLFRRRHLVDTILRPIRSTCFVSRPVARRCFGTSDPDLELLLKEITGVKDGIRNFTNELELHTNDYEVFLCDCDDHNDEAKTLQNELANLRKELYYLRSDIGDQKKDFRCLIENFDSEMSRLETDTNNKLNEIMCAIEKTNTTIMSVRNDQHKSENSKSIPVNECLRKGD